MLDRVATLQLDVQNFALVTHAVPAERVTPHVPDMFELQTFAGDDGREMALVSANGFCNRQVHWVIEPSVHFTLHPLRPAR